MRKVELPSGKICNIVNKIGEGSHGIVYKIILNNNNYVMKIEKRRNNIYNELYILRRLNHSSIPKVLESDVSNGFIYIIMPIFHASLSQIQSASPGFFTPAKINLIGITLINTLKYIHKQGYVYRDMKPENIMIGYDKKVYLIDFGMCKPYIVNGKHIKKTNIENIVGTVRYASINTHNGNPHSRRDDLVSLIYVLISLLKGSLPWSKIDYNDHIEMEKMKKNIDMKKFLSDVENSKYLIEFLEYVSKLRFEETPDYLFLEELLDKYCNKVNFNKDEKSKLLPSNKKEKTESMIQKLFCCKCDLF